MIKEDLERFKIVLEKENLKFTPQRFDVFKEVCDSDEHRESEEIYLTLRQRSINVSRATVYRTMDLLYKHGFVRRMDLGDGKWRYEHWLDCTHHDHLICIRCGIIVEFLDPGIEKLQEEICNRFNYQLVRHVHQLFGLCKRCQEIPM